MPENEIKIKISTIDEFDIKELFAKVEATATAAKELIDYAGITRKNYRQLILDILQDIIKDCVNNKMAYKK